MAEPNIQEKLSAPLDHTRVKKFGSSAGSKKGLSYLEGHNVIRELNEVFDFIWSHRVKKIELLSELEHEGRDGKPRYSVAFLCVVQVTARVEDALVTHEGVGTGSSTMGTFNRMDAMEVAMKEAETDGLKRAAMKYGDRFGLALYDKEQENVTKPYSWQNTAMALLGDVMSKFKVKQPEASAHIKKAIAHVRGEAVEFKDLTQEEAAKVCELAIETPLSE